MTYGMSEDEADNYFRGEVGTPHHLSVGAVVLNINNEVLSHYFKKSPTHDLDEIYTLMRETLRPHETIEDAIKRGLAEEFGIKANQEAFVGTLLTHFPGIGKEVEKTTLYFLCRYIGEIDEGRRTVDSEAVSTLKWVPIDDLAKKMQEQFRRTQRTDLDESKILQRVKSIIATKR